MRHRNGVVGLMVGEQTGGNRRSSTVRRGRAVAQCEGLLEPASTLAQIAPRQPERRRRRRQRKRAILVFAAQIPAHRGPQVRLLGIEALTITAASQRCVERGVRGANIVLLATRGKLLERKLPDCLG